MYILRSKVSAALHAVFVNIEFKILKVFVQQWWNLHCDVVWCQLLICCKYNNAGLKCLVCKNSLRITCMLLLSVVSFIHDVVAAFYRASYASTVLAVIVCLSICLSVTSRSCTKMAKPRITLTTPYDSPATLVFWRQNLRVSPTKSPPTGGAK